VDIGPGNAGAFSLVQEGNRVYSGRPVRLKVFNLLGDSTAKGGIPHMPLVKIKEDETFENALRRFKRKCEKSGIMSELKKRQFFEKPSAKRKRKMLAARKKTLKRLAQERRIMG